MKHLFFFCSLLLLLAISTRAQLVIKPAVGINLTDLSKDPATGEFKSQVGWQIGGSLAFGKKVYLEPGFYYGKKSSKYQSSGTSASDIDFDLSGIRIPVAVGVNLLGSGKSPVGLRIFGGGSAFILTDIKDFDKDDFKSATWGVFAGAGLDLSLFFLDAQYEWSLSDVGKDLSMIDIGKTRSIFIQAGVRIAL